MNGFVTWLRAKLPAVFAIAWEWVAWAMKGLWASIAALLKSPAVWLACGAVFVGGFAVGHGVRAPAVAQLKADKSALAQALKSSVARETAATKEVASLKKQLQEAKEAAAVIPAPEVAPKPKTAPAVKKPRVAAKPAAPAPFFRNPFGG